MMTAPLASLGLTCPVLAAPMAGGPMSPARAGTLIVQTVLSAAEARLAAEAGADVLAVQALGAGGHSGTLTPQQIPAAVPLPELTAAVAGETGLPVVAAGGLSTPDEVAAVLRAGAHAVTGGTPLPR